MSISKGLVQLGFVSDKDFVLQDNGNGPEIRDWNSDKPQPTTADIEAAYTEWQTAYGANESAKTSGRDKLAALGLTIVELDALGIE